MTEVHTCSQARHARLRAPAARVSGTAGTRLLLDESALGGATSAAHFDLAQVGGLSACAPPHNTSPFFPFLPRSPGTAFPLNRRHSLRLTTLEHPQLEIPPPPPSPKTQRVLVINTIELRSFSRLLAVAVVFFL